MRSLLSLPPGLVAMCLLAFTSTIEAHTWVEEVRLIAANGSFTGAPGYIRGFGPRLPGVNPDEANVFRVPEDGRPSGNVILVSDPICKPSQNAQTQTPGFPRLTAAPQDHIALRYLENGHVTLFTTQKGKPAGRGTIFIYGTATPLKTDTYLGIHRVWNKEGSGGDKRGRLIATRPFDDGRCFQQNKEPLSIARMNAINFSDQGGDVMCQADFQLPKDIPTSGTYSLYWVWEWPTLDTNGGVHTNESYTSCLDIDMTSQPIAAAVKFSSKQVAGAAANAVAMPDQFGTQFAIDPTALPQSTKDNLPTNAPRPGQPQGPPAPASPAAPTKAPEATSSPAQGGFVTVTVTTKEISTAYVTVTREAPAATSKPSGSPKQSSQKPSVSTATVVPLPASASSVLILTGAPKVTPFLPPPVPNSSSRVIKVRGRPVRP